MQMKSLGGWLKLLGGVLILAGAAAYAGAQMPEGQGGPGGDAPPAFAGGQMIRGTVTGVEGEKITVKTETGEVYQVALSANTRLMKARQPLKVTDVKAGDGLGAMGVLDASTKTVHAVFVTVLDAEDVKKAREGMGKLYIVGKVTAMDDVKLTILRPDGVSQVIEVDESTSFRRGGRGLAMMMNGGMGMGGGGGRQGGETGVSPRQGGRPGGGAGGGQGQGGESITLADVKVGDAVAGQGAMKHGIFVPTELGVADPAAVGQRRRRPNSDGTPAVMPASPTTPPGGTTPQ